MKKLLLLALLSTSATAAVSSQMSWSDNDFSSTTVELNAPLIGNGEFLTIQRTGTTSTASGEDLDGNTCDIYTVKLGGYRSSWGAQICMQSGWAYELNQFVLEYDVRNGMSHIGVSLR